MQENFNGIVMNVHETHDQRQPVIEPVVQHTGHLSVSTKQLFDELRAELMDELRAELREELAGVKRMCQDLLEEIQPVTRKTDSQR